MTSYHGLHPKIKEQILASECLEEFTVWSRAGNGRWCQLFDMKERVSVEVYLNEEDNVMAKPSATILGFSGFIQGNELCLPNKHLYTEIMQILTILEFIPREKNINDLTHKVYYRWAMESRESRDKEINEIYRSLVEQAALLPDEEIEAYVRDLCALHNISLENKSGAYIYTNSDSLLKRVARKIYKNREEG